jgi:TonB-dependent starch-binding outer membrane protein SusC
MNKLLSALMLLLLSALFTNGAAAQDRGTITGQVVDDITGQPLASVQVIVTGTTLGTITNAQGRFIIANVPAGQVTLRASRIGYGSGTREVQVAAGASASAEFRLAPAAVALDEIVVTGTAGAVQRRSQPAVVATIDAAEVTQTGVTSSIQDVLTARVPGVNVTRGSGTAGTAQQIRIRGASSISLSNEPLVFIDGVRADSRTQSENEGGGLWTGGQGISRMFDLNPDDIESIEVVKGPAAATLYGADASAGVIQIITKRGRAGGARFSQSLSLEMDHIDPAFRPLTNYGVCSSANVAAGSGRVLCEGRPVGTIVTDSPLERMNAFQNGARRAFTYSARGGGESYGYYFSMGLDREDGNLPNSAFDRRTGRLNFNFTPDSRVSVDAGIGLYSTLTDLPLNDNNVYGFLGIGMLGNPVTVRRDEAGNLIGGTYAQRSRESIESIESTVDNLRYTPTLQLNYQPTSWFSNRLVVGGDFGRGNMMQFFPRNDRVWYQGDTNTGELEEIRNNYDVYTVDYLGTVRRQLRDNLSSSFSFGTQLISETLDRVTANGVGFVTNANRVIGAATQISASQAFSQNRSLGFLGQLDLGLSDRLFLQAGARVDQHSSFGAEAEPFFLPKVGVSYVMSEEPFWTAIAGVVPTMRVRAAYGTTGRSPNPGASLETYSARPFAELSGSSAGAGVAPNNPGNPNLRPERGEEFEAGFDAGLLGDRFGLELTYFDKRTTDLLLQRPTPPSAGFTTNPFVNIGEVRNRGLEYAVSAALVTTPRISWDVRVAGSTLHNELVSLGDVEPFGAITRFSEGRQLGYFSTHRVRSVDVESGIAIVSDTLEYVANSLPTNEGSVSSTLTLFGNLRLAGVIDWKRGFSILNDTRQFRDRALFNSEIAVNCEAVIGPEGCMRLYGDFVSESGDDISLTQVNEEYIEDGSFARFRELTATIGLPAYLAQRMGASGASLSIGARNIALWTNYSGFDPEVIGEGTRNVGAATFLRSDFLTQPPSRRIVARVNLTF